MIYEIEFKEPIIFKEYIFNADNIKSYSLYPPNKRYRLNNRYYYIDVNYKYNKPVDKEIIQYIIQAERDKKLNQLL